MLRETGDLHFIIRKAESAWFLRGVNWTPMIAQATKYATIEAANAAIGAMAAFYHRPPQAEVIEMRHAKPTEVPKCP